MANTGKIIGYVVKNNRHEYVEFNHVTRYNFLTERRPAPISKPDAYRRLAAFLEENDSSEDMKDDGYELYVAPVFYEPSPIEKASAELGTLLTSLCQRHGLDLGLTQEEINKQLEKELEAFKASGEVVASKLVRSIACR